MFMHFISQYSVYPALIAALIHLSIILFLRILETMWKTLFFVVVYAQWRACRLHINHLNTLESLIQPNLAHSRHLKPVVKLHVCTLFTLKNGYSKYCEAEKWWCNGHSPFKWIIVLNSKTPCFFVPQPRRRRTKFVSSEVIRILSATIFWCRFLNYVLLLTKAQSSSNLS